LEGPTLVLSFCEGVTFARVRRLQQENHTICRIHTAHLVASFASATNQTAVMMQSSVASTQIYQPSSHIDKQRKPFSVTGCRQPVICQAQQAENINIGRRTMAAVLSAMPMALVVQKGSVGHNLINTLQGCLDLYVDIVLHSQLVRLSPLTTTRMRSS
jgi:hypothetical protein